jgi:hypothetical protein
MADPKPAAKTEDLVEVKIGKNLPSIAAKRGDTIKVTREQAASFGERRMLLDQVEADEAVRGARRAVQVSEEESKSGEALRRILKDTESKLYASREKEAHLSDDLRKANAQILELNKELEMVRSETLRAAEKPKAAVKAPEPAPAEKK